MAERNSSLVAVSTIEGQHRIPAPYDPTVPGDVAADGGRSIRPVVIQAGDGSVVDGDRARSQIDGGADAVGWLPIDNAPDPLKVMPVPAAPRLASALTANVPALMTVPPL